MNKPDRGPGEAVAVDIKVDGDTVFFTFPEPVPNLELSVKQLLELARHAEELQRAKAAGHPPEMPPVPAEGLPHEGMTVVAGIEAAKLMESAFAFGKEMIALAQERGQKPYWLCLACVTIIESFAQAYGWSLELMRNIIRQNVRITEVPLVHALVHGAALCGMPGEPKDWPPTHRWVSAFALQDRDKITCELCKKRLLTFRTGGLS